MILALIIDFRLYSCDFFRPPLISYHFEVDIMDATNLFLPQLENINSQRVVGLSAEGNKIGRSGTLCLLVVGCRQVTYIFDVYQLGEDCFSNGLKSFLEDCYILKVIK